MRKSRRGRFARTVASARVALTRVGTHGDAGTDVPPAIHPPPEGMPPGRSSGVVAQIAQGPICPHCGLGPGGVDPRRAARHAGKDDSPSDPTAAASTAGHAPARSSRGLLRKSCRGHFARTATSGRVALTSVGPHDTAGKDESPGDPTTVRAHAPGRLPRGSLRKSRSAPWPDCPAVCRASRFAARANAIAAYHGARTSASAGAASRSAARRAGAISIASIGACSPGVDPSAPSPLACPRRLTRGLCGIRQIRQISPHVRRQKPRRMRPMRRRRQFRHRQRQPSRHRRRQIRP